MDLTFDNKSDSLIVTSKAHADGSWSIIYLFDGFEITGREYNIMQAAALDRYSAKVA